MPIEFPMKVEQTGWSLKITIPKPIARTIGLQKSDVVAPTLTDGEIRVRKLKG